MTNLIIRWTLTAALLAAVVLIAAEDAARAVLNLNHHEGER